MWKKISNWFFVILPFGLVFWSGVCFQEEARWWSVAVLWVRKHELEGKLQLPFLLENWWMIYDWLGELVVKIDNVFPLFPTFIRVEWWKKELIIVFVWLPMLLIWTKVMFKIRSKKIKMGFLILLVLYLLPLGFWVNRAVDNVVVKTGFDWRLPWSDKFVWMWGEDEESSGQTYFEYEWWQRKKTKKATIKLSCLGHHQLFINGETIYRGPMFGVLPKVYYDQIDLTKYVRLGKNKVSIICEYTDVTVHEHEFYEKPGLLIGGYIDDGWKDHNLVDRRLWQVAYLTGIKNKNRISANAGFAKKIDLSSEKEVLKISQEKSFSYEVLPRPLDLLEYEKINVNTLNNGVSDLGKFMPGYLSLDVETNGECEVGIRWGAKLDKNGLVEEYFGQHDILIFPNGTTRWEQFSRRAGRYIYIEENGCVKNIKVVFKRVGMPFNQSGVPTFTHEVDRQIYELSLNTLKNNTQNHFEDCVERERAMYLGDVLAMSKCLMANGKNLDLVAGMIERFSEGQNSDGSFPSMIPSGVDQFIPSYTLQWPVLLELYLEKGGEIEFAEKMYPILEKLLGWAEENESEDGFIYNKNKREQWWSFIDWTTTDDSLSFSTPLQIWYVAALQSSIEIFSRLDRDGSEIGGRAEKLQLALLNRAYKKSLGVFADSFNRSNQSQASLITNALAGKFNLFSNVKESKKAINYFTVNLFTDSPFSQTWVIEWLISAGEEKLALETMRLYWGNMVNEGATSVFERFRLTSSEKFDRGTFSHAWGCGPMYLYKELDF